MQADLPMSNNILSKADLEMRLEKLRIKNLYEAIALYTKDDDDITNNATEINRNFPNLLVPHDKFVQSIYPAMKLGVDWSTYISSTMVSSLITQLRVPSAEKYDYDFEKIFMMSLILSTADSENDKATYWFKILGSSDGKGDVIVYGSDLNRSIECSVTIACMYVPSI